MRRTFALMPLALSAALYAAPVLALDRVPLAGNADSAVVPAADLDRPARDTYRTGRADSYWYWRYRAAYTRWMHNEYSRSGFPVRHRQFRTYARAYPCCQGYRHW